jgi:hypothetical protein
LNVSNVCSADDKLQDLVYETSRVEGPAVEADIAVSAEDSDALRMFLQWSIGAFTHPPTGAAIPSQQELVTDAQTLAAALHQLSSLFLTSSAFRLIFSDAFLTIRQLVADTAAKTGSIATAVERVAGATEEAARPGADGTAVLSERADAAMAEAGSVLDETRERWQRLARESPDRVREAVIGRIQNVGVIKRDEWYLQLTLFRLYIGPSKRQSTGRLSWLYLYLDGPTHDVWSRHLQLRLSFGRNRILLEPLVTFETSSRGPQATGI